MRMILILVSSAATVALAACGNSESEDGPTVVATTGVVASIVEEVAGEDVEVVQLIPDTSTPHDFSLSAQDRAELEDADLIAYNGADLEAGVPIDDAEAPKWALAEHAGPLLEFTEAGAHEHEEGADEGHEEETPAGDEEEAHSDDPHVWMDPTRVAEALPSLADGLAAADPENEADYRSRSEQLAGRLEDLDRELAREVEALPPADRELVTSHDALGYFADRYGFEVVATAFPASGAEAEPSADALAEVTEVVEETGVPALFSEEGDDPQVLEQVAAETGTEVVDDLLVEAPGPAGSYEEMLRHDAETIVSALGG
jgi:ABC-type Zn uptake system ZnuABC Zn-binding protein ZnuA